MSTGEPRRDEQALKLVAVLCTALDLRGRARRAACLLVAHPAVKATGERLSNILRLNSCRRDKPSLGTTATLNRSSPFLAQNILGFRNQHFELRTATSELESDLDTLHATIADVLQQRINCLLKRDLQQQQSLYMPSMMMCKAAQVRRTTLPTATCCDVLHTNATKGSKLHGRQKHLLIEQSV